MGSDSNSCLFDEYLYNVTSYHYTRRNIEYWLLHWPDFFGTDLSSHGPTWMAWSTARLDVLQAVEQLPPFLQDVFQLVSVEQLDFAQAADELGIGYRSVCHYWRSMKENVIATLLDQTIYNPRIPPHPYPNLSSVESSVGKFDDPVLP